MKKYNKNISRSNPNTKINNEDDKKRRNIPKRDYEKIREEVAKRYKDEISELKILNQKLCTELQKERDINRSLRYQLNRYEDQRRRASDRFRELMGLALTEIKES